MKEAGKDVGAEGAGESRAEPKAAKKRQTLAAKRQKQVFPDAKAMKAEVRKNLTVERYDVTNFYYTEGICQAVARAHSFENLTLAVIAFNALWISIDTDHNGAETLNAADPVWVIMENLFCMYFVFEWIVRFGAFKNKLNCLRDAWMVFDSIMVCMMVFETWVMFIMLEITGQGASLGNAGTLRLLRLLRLSRMARMAKLLRSMPELLILVKGMVAAVRSVFFTLLLLFLIMYVFAIFFRQMVTGDMLEDYFSTTLKAIHTMIVFGTLCDSLGEISIGFAEGDEDHKYILVIVWYLFVLLSAILLMNMLIGVMCEVITAVADTEKEEIEIIYMREQLKALFANQTDRDPAHTPINKELFEWIVEDPEDARRALEDIGLVTEDLLKFRHELYGKDDEEGSKSKSFSVEKLSEAILKRFKVKAEASTELPLIIVGYIKKNMDEIPNITSDDFLRVLLQHETANVLQDVDVDPFGLSEILDTIFAGDDGTEKLLSFNDLLTVMLDHRNSKEATVEDVTDLRKYVRARATKMQAAVDDLRNLERHSRITLEAQIAVLGQMLESASGMQDGHFKEESMRLYTDKLTAKAKACTEAINVTNVLKAESPRGVKKKRKKSAKAGSQEEANQHEGNQFERNRPEANESAQSHAEANEPQSPEAESAENPQEA